MEKLLDNVISLVRDQGGDATLFFILACALLVLAWHQYLRIARHKEEIARHKEDLERERVNAQRAREELTRLEGQGLPQDLRRSERRSRSRRSSSRVLVVEDNDEMQIIIPAMLNRCLHTPDVKISSSTSEAVEELDRFRPELLILDLNLGGQSGLDVLKYLKQARPDLPVLVYTGYEEELVRALKLRRDTGLSNVTVLQKGPDIDAFVRLVPQLFRRRTTDRPLGAPDAQQGAASKGRRDRRVNTTDRRNPRAGEPAQRAAASRVDVTGGAQERRRVCRADS
jgi:CheY-like chemotaxis protein